MNNDKLLEIQKAKKNPRILHVILRNLATRELRTIDDIPQVFVQFYSKVVFTLVTSSFLPRKNMHQDLFPKRCFIKIGNH